MALPQEPHAKEPADPFQTPKKQMKSGAITASASGCAKSSVEGATAVDPKKVDSATGAIPVATEITTETHGETPKKPEQSVEVEQEKKKAKTVAVVTDDSSEVPPPPPADEKAAKEDPEEASDIE